MARWRRDFHSHPELGFQEVRTAKVVAETLATLDFRVNPGVGRTGVVAEQGGGSPIVAIRADMDALPLLEENDVPYASRVHGAMHACGHDAHTAIALGAATLLAEERFPGTVRLLFQPAEEIADEEGLSGAPHMVQDGAMDSVDAVLALHVHSQLATGQITIETGPASAGVDSFAITIHGRAGHGAYPHKGLNPIHLAGHVILALHAIPALQLDPFQPTVLNLGSIHGGSADNVIPESVKLLGSIRYRHLDSQRVLRSAIERAADMARTLGAECELEFQPGGFPVMNAPGIVAVVTKVAEDLLGPEGVGPAIPNLTAEDFAAFTALAPGAFFWLGCRVQGDARELHTPRFDIDEDCLPIGAAMMAETALRLLRDGIPTGSRRSGASRK
jgi:amidohydrolase